MCLQNPKSVKEKKKSMVVQRFDQRSMMLDPVHHYQAATGYISNNDEHSHEETWII